MAQLTTGGSENEAVRFYAEICIFIKKKSFNVISTAYLTKQSIGPWFFSVVVLLMPETSNFTLASL